MNKKIAVLFLGIVLLVAACTTKNVNNDNAIAGQDNVANGEQNQQEAGNSGSEQNQPTGDSVNSFFEKLGAKAEYKAKYDIKMTVSGKTTSAVETMAVKGKNLKTEIETEGGKASTYFIDSKTYSCSAAAGQTMCFEIPAAQADTKTTERENDLRENWKNYQISPKGTRTVARKLATCFGYTVDNAQVEYCFSTDGVPLYIRSDSEGNVVEMTASEYSTSVSDSEFELPAEVQKIPSYN